MIKNQMVRQGMLRYWFCKKYGWKPNNDYKRGFELTFQNLVKNFKNVKKNNYNYKLLLTKKAYKYPLLENALDKDDLNQGIKVIRSGFITMSKHTANFEKKFAKKLKTKYALMVNSGSSANLLATFASCNPWRKIGLKEEIRQLFNHCVGLLLYGHWFKQA